MNNKEYIKIQETRHESSSDRGEMSPWVRIFLEKYSKYIEPPVLEIGCLNGLTLEYLNENGIFSIGLDITRKNVWNCINHKKPVPAIWHNAEEPFPFPDKTFKTVLMFHTFEHLQYPHKALKNICRVLDGNLCIIGPLPDKEEMRFGHFATFKNEDDFLNAFSDYKILEFNKEIHPGILLIANNK